MRVPGVWAICQLSCENVCAWCLSHLQVKTMHSSVCLVFEPSAMWKNKHVCRHVPGVWAICQLAWKMCVCSVWAICHVKNMPVPGVGPSADFCVKNVRVPDVWAICQLPREEYACVHLIFRPSVHDHVHTWCLGHLPTSTWRICMCAPDTTLPCENICTHLSWRMYVHTCYLVFGPPANFHVKNMHGCIHVFCWLLWRICMCVCASSWLHVCNVHLCNACIWCLGHLPTSVWRQFVCTHMWLCGR